MKKSYAIILLLGIVLITCQITNTQLVSVNMPAPVELKKYLTNNPQKKTCYLSADFAPNNIEPFISTLAGLPSDVDGKTAKLILLLLYNWALSADTKNEQVLRTNKIKSCIEEITDPDAHEELSYWFNKCAEILPKTSSTSRATALDLFDNIDVPTELESYSLGQEDNIWFMNYEKFSVEQIPDYIDAILSIPLPDVRGTRPYHLQAKSPLNPL